MTQEEVKRILQKINEEAENFLQDDVLITLKNNSLDEDDFKHRVTMDTFYASMLDVLAENFPDIEKFVEHDIASWIESNTSDIVVADFQKTWSAIELKIAEKLSSLQQ